MNRKRLAAYCLLSAFVFGIAGCADKELIPLKVSRLAGYSGRPGEANALVFMYSGYSDVQSVKAFVEKIGCDMLYAYFYPDTVPISEIPVEEVNTATSFSQVHEILYNGAGYARWRYAAQCFSVIPFISDCYESPVSQNCR